MDGRNRSGHPEAASMDEILFNHIALPPRLPQREDRDIASVDTALITRVTEAAKLIRDLPANPCTATWDSICRSVAACKAFSAIGRLERSVLKTELKHVSNTGFLLLHLRCQNAAILIQRSSK